MARFVNPPALAAHPAAYSYGVVIAAAASVLHTAGIVATRADGSVPHDLAEQADQVWANLATLVSEAGFVMSDTVSYTTYVVHGEDLAVVMAARDRALQGHRAASTLIVVPALARPEWKVEIALIAADG